MIVWAESGPVGDLRARARADIAAHRAERTDAVVVDLGGALNPWADGLVDYYVDIAPTPGLKNVIQGDICGAELWPRIAALKPTFAIATHTLEDIRDPAFVLNQINTLGCDGFISFPNKHTELSSGIDSFDYVGYRHHRWIFAVHQKSDGAKVLSILAKWPYYSSRVRGGLADALYRTKLFRRPMKRGHYRASAVREVDPRQVNNGYELAVRFKEGAPFRFFTDDFVPHGEAAMDAALARFVSEGI